ncbi:MAG: response regulator transcription factor [Cytophagales bacterium]|nr:response regulator transcription factor [Cytophagales bacterium]
MPTKRSLSVWSNSPELFKSAQEDLLMDYHVSCHMPNSLKDMGKRELRQILRSSHAVLVDLYSTDFGLIRLIRKHTEGAHIPVVALDVYAESVVVRAILDKGFDAYLLRYCFVEELEAALASVARGEQFISEHIKTETLCI